MNNIGNSLLLLIIGLVLLWLAATDRLSKFLDAWDLIKSGQPIPKTAANTLQTPAGQISFTLPSLPKLGNNAQVPI